LEKWNVGDGFWLLKGIKKLSKKKKKNLKFKATKTWGNGTLEIN